jgi:mannose-6-phosphate isomerase-like protein (cupin superfamily)
MIKASPRAITRFKDWLCHNAEPRAAADRGRVNTPRAYKRSPALSNSTWYKGILASQMAAPAKIKRGTEPPPHVHSREDEFLYLFSGEIKVYVDGKVFTAKDGECEFFLAEVPMHG